MKKRHAEEYTAKLERLFPHEINNKRTSAKTITF
jgi:hypothetical protein